MKRVYVPACGCQILSWMPFLWDILYNAAVSLAVTNCCCFPLCMDWIQTQHGKCSLNSFSVLIVHTPIFFLSLLASSLMWHLFPFSDYTYGIHVFGSVGITWICKWTLSLACSCSTIYYSHPTSLPFLWVWGVLSILMNLSS